MEILISNNQNKIEVNEKLTLLIRTAIEKSLKLEQVDKPIEISVALVDNEKIQQLNLKYRKIDSATDVLSFPLVDNWKTWKPEPYEKTMILGDIIISLERAVEQSNDYGHSLDREMAFLTVHGVLHLLGYDHDLDKKTELMRQKEEEVLSILGLER